MPRFDGIPVNQQQTGAAQQKPRFGGIPVEQQEISTAGNISSGLNEGIARTLGLPVDAVSGAINAAASTLGSDFRIDDPVGGAQFFNEVLTNLGAIGDEPTTSTGRIVRRGAEEVGAAVFPGLGVASAPARLAGPIGKGAQLAQQAPARFAATETGLAAAGGTAAGAVEESGGGEVAQLAAQVATPLALSGAATAIPAAVRGVARGGEAGRKTVEETIETFAESGATPTLGQATRRNAIQNLETLSSKAPGGGTPFFKKANETVKQIQNRVNTISDELGKGATPERAGRAIKRGIVKFTDDFKERASVLYNKLDDSIPKETSVSVNNTKTLLDDLAAPIPGAEATTADIASDFIVRMQKNITTDAVDGAMPYGALKVIRSRVGEKLTDELITDVSRAQLKRVYGAISKDMEEAANLAGASQQFSRANNFWKAGLNRVDDFLEPLAKKVEPEQIFLNATKGKEGATKIRAVMGSLKPKERELVAATVLKRLGKARPSAQEGLEEVFSTETFLTNWSNLSTQARSALFSGSKKLNQYANNIDRIVKTTGNIRGGSRALFNPSGTSSQFANIGTGVLAAGGVVQPQLLALAGTVFVGNNAMARLMTSPSFVKFLADSTRFPAHRLPSLVTRLAVESEKEGVQIQQDVQEYLEAFQKESE